MSITTEDSYAPAPVGGLVDHLNTALDEQPARPYRQPGKLYELWLEGRPDTFTVRVANRELIAWEKTAGRHKEWPMPTEDRPELGRHLQMTFCTYVAAKRAGEFEGTFDQWQEALIDWEPVRDEPADPTR